MCAICVYAVSGSSAPSAGWFWADLVDLAATLRYDMIRYVLRRSGDGGEGREWAMLFCFPRPCGSGFWAVAMWISNVYVYVEGCVTR